MNELSFKPFQKTDIIFKLRWLNQPSVNRYFGETPGKRTTLKKQEAWFEKCKADKNRRVLVIYCDGVRIGFMGLFNINRPSGTAEAFIAIGEEDYRGKGWGQKAFTHLINFGFDKLKLQKIALGVFEANEPAIKLYEKMGFETEGKLKREALLDGKFQTLLLMAKFRKL